ncbi:MAG: hypothetical protein QOI98_1955 [Solirubrobacteraceae bacterium]|nr:hypothetical protein [Solirubrobacteraceae bacterium]
MAHRINLSAALAFAAFIGVSFAFVSHLGATPRVVMRGEVDGARYRVTTQAARGASVPVLPAPGALHFAVGAAPADQQAVLAAIAGARPEARRIVDMVTGLTTISFGPIKLGVAGQTQGTPTGYSVRLDLGRVSREYGARGISRVTLHELGHVVDGALVTGALEQQLDAAIPQGWGCDEGGTAGACANRAERFAETFAKWATGDIGVDIYLGYKVPPPVPLDAWGAPLAALAR